MKKILEVLMSDDGSVTINHDGDLGVKAEDLLGGETHAENLIETLMDAFINKRWKDSDKELGNIIRILGMAEAMSCQQPYDVVENFWTGMMFSFIPRKEKYASSQKAQFGFDDSKVTRPRTWVNPDIMDIMSESDNQVRDIMLDGFPKTGWS